MSSPCTSAEIIAPRVLAAAVPYSEPVILSSVRFRAVCRAVSLSVDGVFVLSSRSLPKGRPLCVSLPVNDKGTLELSAVVAHESTHRGRRALEVRFINLDKKNRILLEGLVAAHIGPSEPCPGPPKRAPSSPPSRPTVIAPKNEFDGLPSTDEMDSMLASTLAELGAPPKPKRKGRW